MATNKIQREKTLAYATAFIFNTNGTTSFRMGNKIYQHVKTVYDRREYDGGYNTLEVAYDFKNQKYVVLPVYNEKIGNKEITIL